MFGFQIHKLRVNEHQKWSVTSKKSDWMQKPDEMPVSWVFRFYRPLCLPHCWTPRIIVINSISHRCSLWMFRKYIWNDCSSFSTVHIQRSDPLHVASMYLCALLSSFPHLLSSRTYFIGKIYTGASKVLIESSNWCPRIFIYCHLWWFVKFQIASGLRYISAHFILKSSNFAKSWEGIFWTRSLYLIIRLKGCYSGSICTPKIHKF